MHCKFCGRDASDGLRWARYRAFEGLLSLSDPDPSSIFYACPQCLSRRLDQRFVFSQPDRNFWGWADPQDTKPPPRSRKAEAKSSPKAKAPATLVYLVEAGGLYKIGVTNNMRARLKSIQTGNPHKATVVRCIEHPLPRSLETELHQQFSGCRMEGEWFRLDSEAVRVCESIMLSQIFA
jgi:Meiotically up-regulated gene 113